MKLEHTLPLRIEFGQAEQQDFLNSEIFRVRGTILLAVLVRGHFVMTWLKVLSSNFLDLGYSSGR